MKQSVEIEKINSKIGELKGLIKEAGEDIKKRLEGELQALKDKREQILAGVDQDIDEIDD
ncbi:MAG: hypothetical protein WCO12_02020 [bacterium]